MLSAYYHIPPLPLYNINLLTDLNWEWWHDIEVCFIKYDASGVSRYGPFIEIIINALRASLSLFSLLLLLVLIHLILPPYRSAHALLTGIIYAILAIEVIIGYSSMLLLPQIYFKNTLVALISGFNSSIYKFISFFN